MAEFQEINNIEDFKKDLDSLGREELVALTKFLLDTSNQILAEQQDCISEIVHKLVEIEANNDFGPAPFENKQTGPFAPLYRIINVLEREIFDRIEVLKTCNQNLQLQVVKSERNQCVQAATVDFLTKQNEKLTIQNEELNQLLDFSSRDLRKTIVSLIGLNHLVLKGQPHEANEYLRLMLESASRLDAIIRHLGNYSWNSNLEIDAELIFFNTLLQEILGNYSQASDYKKVKMILKINDCGSFFTDKNRLKIILENIIDNAFKFINLNHSRPTIKIKIAATSRYASIRVSDNGEGISPAHIDRAFEMFFKGSSFKEGAGLGLFLAKKAVVRLGGKIEVRSQWDRFSSFRITIPNLNPNLVG